jgi:predicted DNA-binding transcriptional regulator YafY
MSRERGDGIRQAVLALRALVRARWTAEQLSQELGHDVRTTYRLLGGIEAAGVPVAHEREDRNVYHHVSREDLVGALGLK